VGRDERGPGDASRWHRHCTPSSRACLTIGVSVRYPDHDEIIEAGDAYYMVPGHLPFIEGCLERIGEDDPEEEQAFRDLWEDETQREVVIESLKADCEVRTGRP
jgi:hypothetical protein